ncbi:MAG: M1 family metallopeptidase [Candidatus Velthaea sp.]
MHFRFRYTLASVPLGLALCAPAGAEAPFSFDATPGRLPKTVVPLDYTIALTPDVTAHTLSGTEIVKLAIRKPTNTIVFNTLDMKIGTARVDGKPARVKTDNTAQLSKVTTASPLGIGTHTLALAYTGVIRRTAEGLFYQPYRTPDGKTKELLSTQMESTDARRMFPAWDEPAFRSTYKLSVTLPANYVAVSNTPIERTMARANARKTTTFARTPKMSSYLVVLTAGELESIGDTQSGVKLSVYTTEGKKNSGRYALETAKRVLAYYNDYFGVKFPLPKLDMIAIPGGFGGAMENWGGITYNEQILLFDPTKATVHQKQEVFSVETHEMAHQWFGDLVTMAWWDNLWLNEGFASWMGTKAEDHFNPDWRVWEAASTEKESAMEQDARLTTHPIQQRIETETQAAAAFDDITYLKGQSFLRMLESYLGEATFRRGIRAYIAAHKYSNSTTADLWKALEASSGKPVAQIARAWTEQSGFPLVTVAATCAADGRRTLALAQKRFLLSGSDSANATWAIPVGVQAAGSAPAYTLMTGATATVPGGNCADAVSVNNEGIGFYRVQYDAATMDVNRRNVLKLGVTERNGLLDDTWALVQAGMADAGAYLSLATAVGPDLNETEFGGIIGTLGAMQTYEQGQPGEEKFRAYARSLLRPAFDKLGWDAKPGDDVPMQQLRRRVVGALGFFGDSAVIDEAKRRFATFVREPKSLSPDDQGVVVGIVGKYADRATYDRLHDLARKSKSIEEKERYYYAMAAAKDDTLAAETLKVATSDNIPPEIAASRVRLVGVVAASGHSQMAWEFYKANATQLTASFSTFERVLRIAEVPNTFWNAAPANELESYVKKNVPADAAPYVAKSIDRVRFRQALQARLVPEVDTAVAASGSYTNTGAGVSH